MKSCEEYLKYGSLYVSGDLDSEEEKKYKIHMESCPVCRELVNEEIFFLDVASEDIFVPDSNLDKNILDIIDEESTPVKVSITKRFFVPFSAAASVLLIVMASYLYYSIDNSIIIPDNSGLLSYEDTLIINNVTDDAAIYYAENVSGENGTETTVSASLDIEDELDDFESSINSDIAMLDFMDL